jgi:hypothetical protein
MRRHRVMTAPRSLLVARNAVGEEAIEATIMKFAHLKQTNADDLRTMVSLTVYLCLRSQIS